MTKLSQRRILHARPREASRGRSGRGASGGRGALVAAALMLLLLLAAYPLLQDDKVTDNLGAALRHWSGTAR